MTGEKWMGDLSQVEGKDALTKEVDAALLAGQADLAVHCVKDIPADRPLPAGTTFAAFLKRDDIRDAFIHQGSLPWTSCPLAPGLAPPPSAASRSLPPSTRTWAAPPCAGTRTSGSRNWRPERPTPSSWP